MFLILTLKTDGKKIVVNSREVKLVYPEDGGGTHVVLGADLGRIVAEDFDLVAKKLSAVVP